MIEAGLGLIRVLRGDSVSTPESVVAATVQNGRIGTSTLLGLQLLRPWLLGVVCVFEE